MFIRIKSIKAKKYAYLVENNWKKVEARWQIVSINPQLRPFNYRTYSEKTPKQKSSIQLKSSSIQLKKSSRQKVVGYLGRVHEFETPTKNYSGELVESYKESINKILEWHLEKYGFKKRKNTNIMINKDVICDLDAVEVKNKKTNSNNVIKSFDGYICNNTLRELYEFDGLGYDEEVGKRLANTLVKAGMNISKETFVALFEKIFRGDR